MDEVDLSKMVSGFLVRLSHRVHVIHRMSKGSAFRRPFPIPNRLPMVFATLLLAGCLAGEAPVPPEEALARADQRIAALLAEDKAFHAEPAAPELDRQPRDPSAVTFWYYSHPNMAALVGQPALLATFNANHPEAHLSAQYIGDWSVAVQKLTVSLAAGDVPDLALVDRAWLARLVDSGRLAELDTLLPEAFLSSLRPEARAALSARGHLYALPADGCCSVLFYNRERITGQPPRTWDELTTVARALGTPDPDPRQAVYALGDVPFIETLWSAGGDVCDAQGCGLNRPEAHEALRFILGLRDARLAHPYALGNPEQAFDLFLMGKVAMTVASSDRLTRAQQAPFPVGVAPIPGKSGPISRLSDSAVVVFGRYAAAKVAAITQVVAFLTGKDLQGAEAALRGSVPVRFDVAPDAAVPPGMTEAYRAARNTPLVGPWGAVEFELGRYLSLAYRFVPGTTARADSPRSAGAPASGGRAE